ncbi:MAG: DUF1684 domain-containing protein [Anaerolineales bacterium]|jgi:uncharacterized protein (DUF1684 family)
MDELSHFREQKDDFFRTSPQSPLTSEQKQDFKGLRYFPENEELRFELNVDEFEDPEQIQIQTNTGEIQTYTRYGKVEFEVEGQRGTLTVFENENGLFLPFVDSLAGDETYGAGRYLDPHELPGGRLLLDFNLAYNPYCAYNENWSCPLTPPENRLKVPIRAGEKVFH